MIYYGIDKINQSVTVHCAWSERTEGIQEGEHPDTLAPLLILFRFPGGLTWPPSLAVISVIFKNTTNATLPDIIPDVWGDLSVPQPPSGFWRRRPRKPPTSPGYFLRTRTLPLWVWNYNSRSFESLNRDDMSLICYSGDEAATEADDVDGDNDDDDDSASAA